MNHRIGPFNKIVMKIAIDVSQIVYGTGVSNYTSELIKNLLKIDKENTYLLFGASLRSYFKLKQFKNEIDSAPNVHFKFLPLPAFLAEILWNRLRIFPIEKFIGNIDILHSSDWTQPRVKSLETKRITTVHDMIPYLFETSVHPKIVKTHKRRLAKVKEEVDLILADSHTTKEDIVKFLEIPETKIKVVYLAPSEKFKNLESELVSQVLEKYKIKKPYILSVATQEPRKNIQKLLDAFEQIQKRRPELSLVLTGKYGYGPGLRTGENVIITDYVPDEDLIALYSGCRVFAYPSLYEGFGLPVLEAMACGAPVVTSNNSSMAEIAKNTAILVDPRSLTQLTRAIEMVLDLNMENYQKMVRASLHRAQEFAWDITARETLDAYRQLRPVSKSVEIVEPEMEAEAEPQQTTETEQVETEEVETQEEALGQEEKEVREESLQVGVASEEKDDDENDTPTDRVIRES